MSEVPSIRYLTRMLGALTANGELTVTNLAMLSRVNHKRCRSMLNWLERSGFARISVRNQKRYIGLTESGMSYARRIRALIEATN